MSSWYTWFISFLFVYSSVTGPIQSYSLSVSQDGDSDEIINLGGFIYTEPNKEWTVELDNWDLNSCIEKLRNFPIDSDGKESIELFIQALEEKSEAYLADQVDNIYYLNKYLLPIFLIHNNNPKRTQQWNGKRYKLVVKEKIIE